MTALTCGTPSTTRCAAATSAWADVNSDGKVDGLDIKPFVDRLLGTVTPTHRQILRYDYRNQMVESSDAVGGKRNVYAYDALGRRIQKTLDADHTAVVIRFL